MKIERQGDVARASTVALTLNGAAGGNAATSISWHFRNVNGASLRSGSVAC